MAHCGIWLPPISLFILLLRVNKFRQTTSSILVESRLEQRQDRKLVRDKPSSCGNQKERWVLETGDLATKQVKAPVILTPTPCTPHLTAWPLPKPNLPSRLLCPQISPEPEKLLLRAGCSQGCAERGECGPPHVIGNEVGYARELDWKCRRKWLYDSNSKMFNARQTAQRLLLERSSHRT